MYYCPFVSLFPLCRNRTLPAIATCLMLSLAALPGTASVMANPADETATTSTRSQIPGILWSVDAAAATNTAGLMPLWQVSHRGGRLEERQTDGWFGARVETEWRHATNYRVADDPVRGPGGRITYRQGIGHNDYDPDSDGPAFRFRRDYTPWYTWRPDYRAGLEILAKPSSGESRIYEAFLQIRYGPFELTGGRRSYTTGLTDDRISSGSMGMSPNFAPLPRVSLAIPDYIPIPFTYKMLEIKGQYTHAWFDDERFTTDPYLHEKQVFVSTRNDWPFRAHGGFSHFAFWGGEHPTRGPAPSRFQDYLRLIFAQGADPDYKGTEPFPGWIYNAIGDHLGVIEFGLGWTLLGMDWDIYRQYFFEDGSGMRFYHNKDGLNGLQLAPRNSQWINGIVFEYLRTTWQSGPGPNDPLEDPDHPTNDEDYPFNYGGRDNFYNHGVYRHGWTYRGQQMGPTLMLRDTRAGFYYPDHTFLPNRYVSNRAQAWHMGIEGDISGLQDAGSPAIASIGRVITGYRLLLTRARHQGTYSGNISYWNEIIDPDRPFGNKPLQHHMALELSGRIPGTDGWAGSRRIHWTAMLSRDYGELADHTGFLIGLRWGNH